MTFLPGTYNHDQWAGFQAIRQAYGNLSPSRRREIQTLLNPYLEFRRELEAFHERYFNDHCTGSCFETGLSACCGFESIITFFADQLVTFVQSSEEEMDRLLEVLQRANTTSNCVYLGPDGCMWRVRPVSCAMFLCEDARQTAFSRHPPAREAWKELQQREKAFTWPDRPVLFDDLEKIFMDLGLESPQLYFHRSPGLLWVKSRAGLR